MKTSLLLVVVLCIATTYAQITDIFNHNPCFSKSTCHKCIQSPTCAWCFDPNFGNKLRCFQPTSSSYCREEFAWDPYNYFHVVKRNELSSQSSITPQHIRLKLRTNDPYKFKMNYYKHAEDSPVDSVQNSSSVEMKDTARDGIRINYYSSCLDKFGEPKPTNKCENIKVGDVVAFFVEIEVTACPADHKDWKQAIQIYPVSINESLTVDLEMLCSCPCEKPGDVAYIENAEQCSGNGISKCGICECKPGFSGKKCK